MADESFCVKKNPMGKSGRLSLRRASRFYAPNMDETLLTSEKPVKKALVVTHVRKHSNIPINLIRETFKIKTLGNGGGGKEAKRENGVGGKGPANQASGLPVPVSGGRKSASNAGTTERKSVFKRPLGVGSKRPRLRPIMFGSVTKTCEKAAADEGFEYPKALYQSTPNVVSSDKSLRSILKPDNAFDLSCIVEKPKAAKRVNFDGKPEDKENIEEEEEEEEPPPTTTDEAPSALVSGLMDLWKSYQGDKNELRSRFRSAENDFRQTIESAADQLRRPLSSRGGNRPGSAKHDCRVTFLKHILEMENMFKKEAELDAKFEKVLERVMQEHARQTSGSAP